MTPFHILCSCAEPRRDLLQALLQKYPSHVLGWKDTNGKRAMDYLAINWTPETASLLQMALQFWMLHPIQRWGATAWFSDMEDKVNAILVNDHKDNRAGLLRKACSKMDDHRRNESMTILELAMWNKALGSLVRRNSSISRRHLVLNTCGSSCVLSNVAPFLGFDSDY
ncbi:unnamed protein product [Cylindrotheca closterium]|uniref:Uncharacterized protein n=1 Tax=Cylindrotheca closterium TaxID=2856 RepID=A0AAD2CUN0_9STRA|nr:unnamed protein product [Cylindrotheca closterium]